MRPSALLPALVDTRHEYDHLFSIYVPIAVGVFAVIVCATLVAALVYRRRPPERAARWQENNRLESGYAFALTLTAAFLLYITFTAEHRVDSVANRQSPRLTIDVTAAKWEWQFRLRELGVTVRSGTVGRQQLVVPLGEPIRFELASLDVIHAFWVPQLRYKHDVLPGSTQVTTLTFTHLGLFEGECAEFCGLRHSDMVFKIRVVRPPQFAAWLSSARSAPPR